MSKVYQNALKNALVAQTASDQTADLTFCSYSPSEGIQDCPIHGLAGSKNKWGHDEFIVVVHNPSIFRQQLVRIKLDSQEYKAKIWNSEFNKFEDVDTDIVEQVHLDVAANSDLGSKKNTDFEMFVPF